MKNLLKEKLSKGENAVGTFVEMGHPDVTNILSHAGLDWLLIDGEHSPMGYETMEVLLQAMVGTDCTPIIRPQWNDPVVIKRILDLGAHGIVVPWVNTKEEAEWSRLFDTPLRESGAGVQEGLLDMTLIIGRQ